MKKKLFRLLVVLAMIVMPVTGVMINAEAASNLMLGTAVSNNPDTRVFTVKNNGEATTFAWEATGTGETNGVSIARGETKRIEVPAVNGSSHLTVLAQDAAAVQEIASLNQYYINVTFSTVDGTELMSAKTVTCTYNNNGTYTAPSTITLGSSVYDINGNNYISVPYGTRSIDFKYTKRAQTPYTSTVALIDQDGVEHKILSYQVTEANGGSVNTPETFVSTINGRTYKRIAGQKATVSQTYAQGQMRSIVRYQVQDDVASKPYNIYIQYVDKATGSAILTKKLLVEKDKTVDHTPSKTFMKGGKQYEVVDGAKITHTFGDATKTYQVEYKQVITDENTPQPIQVNYVDLATGEDLQIHQYTVDPGKTKTIEVDTTVEIDGKTYVLSPNQESTITHKFGEETTEYNVYFKAKGLEVDKYEVSVTYMNVSNTYVGEDTLYTTKLEANVGQELNIEVPAQYEANGTTYVLMSGQATSYSHDFYSTRRNYVMVYRDVNDTQNEIEFIPGETGTDLAATTPGGTNFTIDGGTGNPMITNPDGTVTTVDQDGQIVPYEEPQTEVVDENETPLAKGDKSTSNNTAYVIGGGFATVAIIAGIVAFVIKKKKAQQA